MVIDGKKKRGPNCTDNFQVIPFEYPLGSGKMWQSAEQCYQAQKFGDEMIKESIREAVPHVGESDSAYGNRVWRLGQRHDCLLEWERVKVEVMYLVNAAKYACNPHLQQELLETGSAVLTGGPSTWQWSKWNGLIQMKIRQQLQDGIDIRDINNMSDSEIQLTLMTSIPEEEAMQLRKIEDDL
jgi:predicted NAD-dependent protein-ADP-ribosyltransferase YbiA (DUF1768 family)